MAVTINGTTGVTTPGVSSSGTIATTGSANVTSAGSMDGITFAESELARAKNVFGLAQQVAPAADIGESEADAAARVLGGIPAILR